MAPKTLPASVAAVDAPRARHAAALVLLEALERGTALARALLEGETAPPPPASETYHAEHLPPGARSWRVVLDAHRRGELRASRVGRKLLVTGEDWAAYVTSRKATPRPAKKAADLIELFGKRRGGR